jgi:hypothetical protein
MHESFVHEVLVFLCIILSVCVTLVLCLTLFGLCPYVMLCLIARCRSIRYLILASPTLLAVVLGT